MSCVRVGGVESVYIGRCGLFLCHSTTHTERKLSLGIPLVTGSDPGSRELEKNKILPHKIQSKTGRDSSLRCNSTSAGSNS